MFVTRSLDVWRRLTATVGPPVEPSEMGVLALLLVFTVAPLWSLRDSKGFRRRSMAQRSLWRRIAYRLTALPGLLLAVALGIVVLAVGALLLGIAWLIGAVTRRDGTDDTAEDAEAGP